MHHRIGCVSLCVLLLGARAFAEEVPYASEHRVGIAVGRTLTEGTTKPFEGGSLVRLFAGTRLFDNLSLEIGARAADFRLPLPYFSKGAIFSVSSEIRFDAPFLGDVVLLFLRGGVHYSQALSYLRALGEPDIRDRLTGAGFVAAAGLRLRLWRSGQDGSSLLIGAEFSSLWIYPQMDRPSSPTLMNSIAFPLGVDW
jgi:hypothetical protein